MQKKIRYTLLLGITCAAFFMGGCATVPITPTGESAKQQYLADVCQRHAVVWEWDSVTGVVTIQSAPQQEAKVIVGKNMLLVNGTAMTLSAPVSVVAGAVVVPADFEQILFAAPAQDTFVETYTLPVVRTVILDPGHGGRDPGAMSRAGTKEKDITLDIALRVKKELREQGVAVILTRKTDEYVALNTRTEMASKIPADLFVSIHVNANLVRKVYGPEVYALSDLNRVEQAEEQRRDNHRRLYGVLSMERASAPVGAIVSDMLYDHKQSSSMTLARDIMSRLSAFIKSNKPRSVKRSHFYVLRNTLIPAVLVEVGFISNLKEERLLKMAAYRQRIAEAIARSILHYGKTN